MNTIQFKPNEPQVLSLKEGGGILDGFQVIYETTDGRILSLPHPAAVKLNELEPAPGEEFSATRYQKGKEPSSWVFALTAKSERERADREAAELEARAKEQAEATKRDLPAQLQASVLRQMPKSARNLTQDAPVEQKGTGTYGPRPQVAYAGGKPERIPFNLAFREVVKFVTAELNASGEQWSEQSRQDLVATVLIAGSKAGWISQWERGEGK